MKKVLINGAEYELRYSLRAFFVYEELAGEPYNTSKLMNSYVLLYAMLLACNKEFDMGFDALIDACDADSSIFQTFCEVLSAEAERVSQLADSDKKKVES